MLFLKFCAILLGLTGPGYMLARCLRLKQSLAAAFPLSALLLTETIILFSILGVPLTFASVSGVLLASMVLCGIYQAMRCQTPVEAPIADDGAALPHYLVIGIALVATTLLVTIAVRTSLYPLLGLDTSFRWEGLARAMLTQHSLDFYPPVNAGDFNHYLFPDGIPPLVATVYWWIYATLGGPSAPATAISVVLQLAATMALTFFAARHAFGSRAAWFALLALTATPLLLISFAIGQESGFLALSVAGQLCFAWAAVRNPQRQLVFAAALFATIGALARDYGPALALSGFAVLAWHRPTRRHLGLYLLTLVCFATPWYLRNWVHAGNPLFSHHLPGGFAVNTTYVAIIDFYKQVFSFGQLSPAEWLDLARQLSAGALLAMVAGGAAFSRLRLTAPLLATALLVTLLWIISVPQTAGGLLYSTRVLAPALVALAIAAGMIASSFSQSTLCRNPGIRALVAGGVIILTVASVVCVGHYPFSTEYTFTPVTANPQGSIQQVMLDKLEASGFPATGVLTDQPFFAALMHQQSRFRPVVVWSPEVDFIFDPKLTPEKIQRRLLEHDIRMIYVDDQSTTNRFLLRYRFFYDSDSWRPLYELPNEGAFYYLDPR